MYIDITALNYYFDVVSRFGLIITIFFGIVLTHNDCLVD